MLPCACFSSMHSVTSNDRRVLERFYGIFTSHLGPHSSLDVEAQHWWRLERWLSGEENVLLWSRMLILFSAPLSGGSFWNSSSRSSCALSWASLSPALQRATPTPQNKHTCIVYVFICSTIRGRFSHKKLSQSERKISVSLQQFCLEK